MTEETQTQYQDVSDEFNFSPDEFREEGYKWRGRVVTAEVRHKPTQTFERKDGSGSFTVEAFNEVNIWAIPLKGRDGEEPKARPVIQCPFTTNKNSKNGFFVSEAAKAGITFKGIKELEGRVFDFEVIEHKKFGNQESRSFSVIRGEDRGAAGVVSAQTASAPASIDWDRFGAQVVELLDGHEANSGALVSAVTASDLRKELTILTAAASGALLKEAEARGLVEVVAGKIQKAA